MKAIVIAVGFAAIARNSDLALAATAALGAAVLGQLTYIFHAARRAQR